MTTNRRTRVGFVYFLGYVAVFIAPYARHWKLIEKGRPFTYSDVWNTSRLLIVARVNLVLLDVVTSCLSSEEVAGKGLKKTNVYHYEVRAALPSSFSGTGDTL
jgi:hypothetical protein